MRFESKAHPIHAAIKNIAVQTNTVLDIKVLVTNAIRKKAQKEIAGAIIWLGNHKNFYDALDTVPRVHEAAEKIKALAMSKLRDIYLQGQGGYNYDNDAYDPFVVPFKYTLGNLDDVINVEAIAESIAYDFTTAAIKQAGIKVDAEIQEVKDVKDVRAQLSILLSSATSADLNALDQNGCTPIVLAA